MRTKSRIVTCVAAAGLLAAASPASASDAGAAMAGAVSNYVAGIIQGLQQVADQQPTEETFRELMKPFIETTPGVFGASLIDSDFVIRQVYHRRDFLAVGYDLKKVRELDYFWKLMREKPAPQLSEPGHGSLIQPRLVAMRCPVIAADGQLQGVVSAMIHTGAFLKAVGLDTCRAYSITCLGKLAEEKGKLKGDVEEIRLALPSTEWVIQFQK